MRQVWRGGSGRQWAIARSVDKRVGRAWCGERDLIEIECGAERVGEGALLRGKQKADLSAKLRRSNRLNGAARNDGFMIQAVGGADDDFRL